MFKEVDSNSELWLAIKRKKAEMITLGERYGLQDQQTIACSQELDTLLNKHLLNNDVLNKEPVC